MTAARLDSLTDHVNGDPSMHPLLHEQLARERIREQAARARQAARLVRPDASARPRRDERWAYRRVRAVLAAVR